MVALRQSSSNAVNRERMQYIGAVLLLLFGIAALAADAAAAQSLTRAESAGSVTPVSHVVDSSSRVTAFSDTFDDCWMEHQEKIREGSMFTAADCDGLSWLSNITYTYEDPPGTSVWHLAWDKPYVRPALHSNKSQSRFRIGNIRLPGGIEDVYALDIRYRVTDVTGDDRDEFAVDVKRHPREGVDTGFTTGWWNCVRQRPSDTTYQHFTYYDAPATGCNFFSGDRMYDILITHNGDGGIYIDYIRFHRVQGILPQY